MSMSVLASPGGSAAFQCHWIQRDELVSEPSSSAKHEDGSDAGLGVSGAGADAIFVGYAAGNVDDDDDWDCWSIATIDRHASGGQFIPAGEPWNERSD